jgi:hypothetical protein
MVDIEDDWETFLQQGEYENDTCDSVNDESLFIENKEENPQLNDVKNIPKCTSLYISTKTKISYLNKTNIDIKSIFWEVPVIKYYTPTNGVIKKQIKYSSSTKEEVDYISEKIKDIACYEEYIIEHIENPEGRIKFKDQRKISIGTCKKDILSYRSKQKRAFFNCFVLILRLFYENEYKEVHVKVFNTGKLEIPGIQTDILLTKVLTLLVEQLRPFIGEDLDYLKDKSETVLINSNFNCGYYIDRDKLHDLLKYKYRINSNFDACSYPGIQCKFYYDNTLTQQTGQQPTHTDFDTVSFMIFRTGSLLVVGKCDEFILYKIYDFLKNILECEYENINSGGDQPQPTVKDRKKKIRKKTIYFDKVY